LMGTPNSARASLKCMTSSLPALGLLMRWSSHTKATVLHQHFCWCLRLLSLLGSDCWSCLRGVNPIALTQGTALGTQFCPKPLRPAFSFLPSELVQNCTPKKILKRKKLLLQILESFAKIWSHPQKRVRQI
jgi:hypothetical protein